VPAKKVIEICSGKLTPIFFIFSIFRKKRPSLNSGAVSDPARSPGRANGPIQAGPQFSPLTQGTI
jgi:hypothetical protein